MDFNLAGTGGLTQNSSNVLTLARVNDYSGTTLLSSGKLLFGVRDSIINSNAVVINGGILDLNGYNQRLNHLTGKGGEIKLAGATLTAVNTDIADSSEYAGAITGHGIFIKEGNGSLTLSGNTVWEGNTKLQAGSLVLDGISNGAQLKSDIIAQDGTYLNLKNGASLTGGINHTEVTIDNTSQWNMIADSLINNLKSSGIVVFSAAESNDFKILTVNGNYIGDNNLLVMNTNLEGDSSLTDKLIVRGNTVGNTNVTINNIGGMGRKTVDSIKIVEIYGNPDGTFTKSGRIVAGAYDYDVVKKGSDWYLTSQLSQIKPTPVNPPSIAEDSYRPESGSYTANLVAANIMFNTRLHDRLGESQYTDALTREKK